MLGGNMSAKELIKDYLSTAIISMMIFLIMLFTVILMLMIFLAQHSVKFAMCLQQIGG